jgi:MerR family transcriptional regulator, thiopeptide resistance regulator
MTPEGDDWIGPGETARRLGVTAKALRVYERERLIRPARTAAGWRVYGPEHLARLHLIVVLRDLGLPLKAVRGLLSQKTPSLVALLTVQQEALEAKRARIDRAIGLLTDARADLAAGRALSLDDLTQLSRETLMSEDLFDTETRSRIKAVFDEHVGAETRAELKGLVEERMRTIGKSKEDILEELRILVAEGRKAMAVGDPNAEPAKAAVRRWFSLFGGVVDKESAMRPQLRKASEAVMADPVVASTLPIDAEVMGFLRTVGEGMRERGELP